MIWPGSVGWFTSQHPDAWSWPLPRPGALQRSLRQRVTLGICHIHVSLSAPCGFSNLHPYDHACLTIKAVCWTLIEVSFQLPALWPASGGFATIDLTARAPAASRFFTLLLLKVMLVIPALVYRPGLVSVLPPQLAFFDIVLLELEPTTVRWRFCPLCRYYFQY